MAIMRTISTYDLLCFAEAKEAVLKEDKKSLEKILYNLGLDVKEPYELEVVAHRPLMKDGNDPWLGPRYTGTERQDKDWLNGEGCSWENKVDACRDPELRAELQHIGRTGCADKVWNNKATAKQVIKEEKKRGI